MSLPSPSRPRCGTSWSRSGSIRNRYARSAPRIRSVSSSATRASSRGSSTVAAARLTCCSAASRRRYRSRAATAGGAPRRGRVSRPAGGRRGGRRPGSRSAGSPGTRRGSTGPVRPLLLDGEHPGDLRLMRGRGRQVQGTQRPGPHPGRLVGDQRRVQRQQLQPRRRPGSGAPPPAGRRAPRGRRGPPGGTPAAVRLSAIFRSRVTTPCAAARRVARSRGVARWHWASRPSAS